MLFEGIAFTATFALMRKFTSGHHANSHWSCVTTFTAILVMALLIARFVPQDLYLPIGTFISITVFVAVCKLAPVEHKNKPIPADLYVVLKIRGRVVVACLGIASVIGVSFTGSSIIFAVLLAMAAVCGSMAYAVLYKNLRRGGRTHENQ